LRELPAGIPVLLGVGLGAERPAGMQDLPSAPMAPVAHR
jgi:hypothetical protein